MVSASHAHRTSAGPPSRSAFISSSSTTDRMRCSVGRRAPVVSAQVVTSASTCGFAASWVTRWYAFDAEAGAMLGVQPGESIVGFVHIGTPTATIEDRPRPALDDIVSRWHA